MSAREYTGLHRRRMGVHMYPTEFLVRTMLGNYPHLELDKNYEGKALLDLGFGDGRNMPLFRNTGARIFGVEPDEEVCAMVRERTAAEGIECDLRAGTNASIPFEPAFFDYVVASHSVYYVDAGQTFEDNLCEVGRVLKPGGWFIASIPDLDNSVLENAVSNGGNHWRITSDPFGLRNGAIFWATSDAAAIQEAFAPWFEPLSLARFRDDWYGLRVTGWVAVGKRHSSSA